MKLRSAHQFVATFNWLNFCTDPVKSPVSAWDRLCVSVSADNRANYAVPWALPKTDQREWCHNEPLARQNTTQQRGVCVFQKIWYPCAMIHVSLCTWRQRILRKLRAFVKQKKVSKAIFHVDSPKPQTLPSLNSPSYFIPSHRMKTPDPLNLPPRNSPSYLKPGAAVTVLSRSLDTLGII